MTLDSVLLVKDASGTNLGKPYVKDATVQLKVMAHRRGPKVIVYKMRPKKKTRRKNGHRQELTRVMVNPSPWVARPSVEPSANDTHFPTSPSSWHIRKAQAQHATVAIPIPSALVSWSMAVSPSAPVPS